MTFYNYREQKKNRPNIEFKIYETKEKTKYWSMFSKYHYLSHNHNNAAKVFIATVNDKIAGFISMLHFPHPKVKNMKKVHRLVVLPDYQGIGIGLLLLNKVGELYKNEKQRFNIVTSSPSLIKTLKKSNQWIGTRLSRTVNQSKSSTIGNMKTSQNRITASFELK
jgi:GNAT superfamily N-acetyltransferase